MTDPFIHHPGLRALVQDPWTSKNRELFTDRIRAMLRERGIPTDWLYSDAQLEEMRKGVLAGRMDSDLWVFGYGSLMWDPGLIFAEVRRAHLPEHARRFILKDIYGGRGDRERPGLMAALDKGNGCDGLAFRIEAGILDEESSRLWRREQAGRAYHPEFVMAETDHGPIEVLTFTADHGAELIDAKLTREQQVEYLATGSGFLGTSMDYIANIARHFDELRIMDEEVRDLLAGARAWSPA